MRRLLMMVTYSILLYGAEIWADATRIEKYRKKIAAVQRRGALRIACAARYVTHELLGKKTDGVLKTDREDEE